VADRPPRFNEISICNGVGFRAQSSEPRYAKVLNNCLDRAGSVSRWSANTSLTEDRAHCKVVFRCALLNGCRFSHYEVLAGIGFSRSKFGVVWPVVLIAMDGYLRFRGAFRLVSGYHIVGLSHNCSPQAPNPRHSATHSLIFLIA
jgi:hypothetical protein